MKINIVMNDFKFFGGEKIDDLGEYLKEYYSQYPDIEIYVGTDSAQHGKITKYATAVSLLRPGKGVHVIYRRVVIKRERDMFTRLWNEVEMTREVGEYIHEALQYVYDIKDKNKKIPILHLDFNKSPKYKSYIVHDLSIGYLKGFQFEVSSKNTSWCATVAADLLVKN